MSSKDIKLKDTLEKLEKLVIELNQPNLDIEVGLNKFKTGVDLIKSARIELTKAENKFNEIKAELENND